MKVPSAEYHFKGPHIDQSFEPQLVGTEPYTSDPVETHDLIRLLHSFLLSGPPSYNSFYVGNHGVIVPRCPFQPETHGLLIGEYDSVDSAERALPILQPSFHYPLGYVIGR